MRVELGQWTRFMSRMSQFMSWQSTRRVQYHSLVGIPLVHFHTAAPTPRYPSRCPCPHPPSRPPAGRVTYHSSRPSHLHIEHDGRPIPHRDRFMHWEIRRECIRIFSTADGTLMSAGQVSFAEAGSRRSFSDSESSTLLPRSSSSLLDNITLRVSISRIHGRQGTVENKNMHNLGTRVVTASVIVRSQGSCRGRRVRHATCGWRENKEQKQKNKDRRVPCALDVAHVWSRRIVLMAVLTHGTFLILALVPHTAHRNFGRCCHFPSPTPYADCSARRIAAYSRVQIQDDRQPYSTLCFLPVSTIS